jgi:hypothetical protein
MTNVFNTAFAARIATAVAKNSTKSNIERLERNQEIVSNQTIETLLTSAKVDASRMLRAMYASFKAFEFVALIVDHKHANNEKNTYAIFRTLINLKREGLDFTKTDAKASISRDYKTTDEKQNVIFVRSAILDEKTVNAQHQTSIDAFVTLNILKERHDKKDTFEIVLNDIAVALANKLEIDISDFELESDRVEQEDEAA